MLYMVTMTGLNRQTGEVVYLVKVGRTQDFMHRVLAYIVHNPLAEWVGHKAGYKKGEAKAHAQMKRYGCKPYKRSVKSEWMELPEGMTAEELAKKMHFIPFE